MFDSKTRFFLEKTTKHYESRQVSIYSQLSVEICQSVFRLLRLTKQWLTSTNYSDFNPKNISTFANFKNEDFIIKKILLHRAHALIFDICIYHEQKLRPANFKTFLIRQNFKFLPCMLELISVFSRLCGQISVTER